MLDESSKETAASLLKMKKVCGFISVVLKIIFSIVCLGWSAIAVLIAASIFNFDSGKIVSNANELQLIACVGYGTVVATMFIFFIKMFSDAAKGESPFVMAQTNRLRLIALLLLLYALFDFFITYNSAILQINGFNSGYVSTNGNTIVAMNIAPLVAAAVVFAFSFVFKYGVLLQQFSDDTI